MKDRIIIVGGGMASIRDCRLLAALIESRTHSVAIIDKAPDPVHVVWDEVLDIKPGDFQRMLDCIKRTPIVKSTAVSTERSNTLDRFLSRQRESRNRAQTKHRLK